MKGSFSIVMLVFRGVMGTVLVRFRIRILFIENMVKYHPKIHMSPKKVPFQKEISSSNH